MDTSRVAVSSIAWLDLSRRDARIDLPREERDGGRATASRERCLLFVGGAEGRAFGDAFPFAVALHEGVDPNIGVAE